MAVVDLDPSRPTAFTLLGISLVLWCDGAGDWHAAEDRCAHRLAPLSEGRVEGGELQCSYHGWRFNGEGRCTLVPQIADPKLQAAACASPRSAVASYPTKIAHGLLWVYGSSTPDAWRDALASAAVPPEAACPELLKGTPGADGWEQATPWFFRDLAVRYDSLTENVLDPSHVQFAHHGVQGSRNNPAAMEGVLRDSVARPGFLVQMAAASGFQYTVSFQAPCLTRYDLSFISLAIYVIPTKPGWSRIGFGSMRRTTAQRPGLAAKFITFLMSRAEWEHPFMRHPTFDGDTYMLHVAERVLAEAAPAPPVSQYFMPAKADATVVAWHKWLARFAGQVPTCEPGVVLPPAMERRQVLDRHAHTKECKACSRALKAVDVATLVAAAVAGLGGLLLLVRCFAAGQPPLLATSTVALAALVAAAGAVAAKLRQLRNVYIFTDWVHADHN